MNQGDRYHTTSWDGRQVSAQKAQPAAAKAQSAPQTPPPAKKKKKMQPLL